jgi:uncharacterized protein YxjI
MSTPAMSHVAFQQNEYVVRRKILALLGAKFYIDDQQGNLIGFSHQKAFKLKEDIRIFTDDQMSHELISIKARKVLDISSAYDVVDSATQQKIGVLKRKGIKSAFLRDEWTIMDANEAPIGMIKEDSVLLAIIRRHVTALVPQTYDFEMGGQRIGQAKQNFNFFAPKMRCDFSADSGKKLDRRLALSAVILLMAIEGRQQ